MPKVPILNETNANFVPLFSWNQSERDKLRYRVDNNERNDSQLQTFTLPLSRAKASDLLADISSSQPIKNMYPFSKSFNSASNTIHFRQLSDSSIVVNFYGSLDPGPLWNMQAQYICDLGPITSKMNWISANRIGTNEVGEAVFSLVGSAPVEGDLINITQLGLRVDSKNHNVSVLWNSERSIESGLWSLVDVTYGQFEYIETNISMIEYWKNASSNSRGTTLKLFSIPRDFKGPPAYVPDDPDASSIK